MFKGADQLGVTVPSSWALITRVNRVLTPEERWAVQLWTSNNVNNFPAPMLAADFLSDSGCATITDVQWAALFRGDEAYGRNHGYYAVLDSVRDVFERAAPNAGALVRKIIVDEVNSSWMPKDEDLQSPPCGGFANGGPFQLARPNFFLLPSQRSAEFLLCRALATALKVPAMKNKFAVVSNGMSDTAEAHVLDNGFEPINIPAAHCPCKPGEPLQGGIDLARLRKLVEERGDSIAVVLLSLTNARGPGCSSSMANVKEAAAIAHSRGIPVVFDAARFAVNLAEIKKHETGYSAKPIREICTELFGHCDAFMTGSRRLSNSGAFLCFRDQGLFHKRFSAAAGKDIGVLIKEAQILNFGNDSYGALSGRDLMAMALGIAQSLDEAAMAQDAAQVRQLADLLVAAGVPGVVTSPFAVFIDMDAFFGGKTDPAELRGVGLVIELIRLYGVRCSEFGPHTFAEAKKAGAAVPNYVRIAIPHGTYSAGHIEYAAAAIAELHKHRDRLPAVRVKASEQHHHLQHLQVGLEVTYPAAGMLVAEQP